MQLNLLKFYAKGSISGTLLPGSAYDHKIVWGGVPITLVFEKASDLPPRWGFSLIWLWMYQVYYLKLFLNLLSIIFWFVWTKLDLSSSVNSPDIFLLQSTHFGCKNPNNFSNLAFKRFLWFFNVNQILQF